LNLKLLEKLVAVVKREILSLILDFSVSSVEKTSFGCLHIFNFLNSLFLFELINLIEVINRILGQTRGLKIDSTLDLTLLLLLFLYIDGALISQVQNLIDKFVLVAVSLIAHINDPCRSVFL
jgi:hypothetical protein